MYTKDPCQAHVNAVWWVFEELRRNSLFANLKKCHFDKDKVRFLGYVVSAQGVKIEEESIDVVKNWPESKSIYDIQVFLGFAHFYCCFIQGFSTIAALLTLMLRMIQYQLRKNWLIWMISLVKVIVGKMKRKRLPRHQRGLLERIIHLLIMSAIPSVIMSAIPPKTSATT